MKIVAQNLDKTEEYSLPYQFEKVHVNNLYNYRASGKDLKLDVECLVQDAVAYFVGIISIPVRLQHAIR